MSMQPERTFRSGVLELVRPYRMVPAWPRCGRNHLPWLDGNQRRHLQRSPRASPSCRHSQHLRLARPRIQCTDGLVYIYVCYAVQKVWPAPVTDLVPGSRRR